MKRFQTRSIMYLRWITFLTVIELLKSWSPSPMALTIHWWPFYPYTIPYTSSKYVTKNNAVKGFLYDILLQTLQTCHPDLENQKFEMTRYSTQQDFLQLVLNQTGHNTEFYMPLTIQDKADHIHKDGLQQRLPPDSTFLPVLECPGSVHFYKKKDEAVGSDLIAVILQGWPMLILILLGAGYSGIIIWLLDRLWNPSNFPKPFIRGFWEGFWWAFVTMTTVGYGDTTPRSLQARMYGLIWIVIGITILSVFTATVTTVLTQQSIGNAKTLHGIPAAVLNGTDDYRLSIIHGAKPIPANDFIHMNEMVSNEEVEAGLLDQFAFASQQLLLDEKVLIQSTVPNPTIHGILIRTNDTSLITCSQMYLAGHKHHILEELQNWIEPLTVKTTTAAESAEKLFQPRTVLYMWYCLAAWVLIFILFVLWEFLYWRPKHRRRKIMKAKRAMDQEQHQDDLSQNTSREQRPAKPIIPKSVQNIARRHFSYRSKHRKHGKSKNIYEPTNDSVSTHNKWNFPETKLYSNGSFQSSDDDEDFKDPLDSESNVEFEGLQDLVQRQNMEIQELQDEYESWYETYTNRVNATKLRHKEEQRQLLRSLHRPRQYERTDGRPLQFNHVYPSHMAPPYHVYPAGVFTTRSTSRSVATTYRPYTMHRLHLNNPSRGVALPVDRL